MIKMVVCAHYNCNNTNNNSRNSTVNFHRFPTVGSQKLNAWINYCRIEDYSHSKSYRLCSEHFSKEQYKCNTTRENIGWKSMKFLKPNVIPDIPYGKRDLHQTYSTGKDADRNRKRQKTQSTEQSSFHLPVNHIFVNLVPIHSSPTVITPQQIRFIPSLTSTPVGPAPVQITPAPVQITPAPVQITPAPVQITPAPVQITPAPVQITPAPVQITPAPVQITPAPVQITPAPVQITPAPVQITPAPVQITPAPVQITPAPVQITPAPVQISPAPVNIQVIPFQGQPTKTKEESKLKKNHKTWSRGTNTTTQSLTREIGTQTLEIKTEVIDNAETDEVYIDNKVRDPDYVPYSENENRKENIVHSGVVLGQKKDADEQYFLVGENALSNLFERCRSCGSECKGKIQNYVGTLVKVKQNCSVCEHQFIWESQARTNVMPLGNLLLGSVILTSGSSPSRVIKLFNQLNTPVFNLQTYLNIQNYYVLPEIDRLWTQQQKQTFSRYKRNQTQVILGGDSRCDSPGHCAKYGTYSLMDLEKNMVLDLQLVQSNEVKNSAGMELEGLKRALAVFKEENVVVKELVTDRHPQVKKYMREQNADIVHYFDVWHMAKGVGKKLEASSKRKGCNVIQPWIKSVTNHMYWVAATSETEGMRMAKWGSIMNHISDKHEGHSSEFPVCQHGPIERKWIQAGSRPFKVMEEIVMSNYLTRDIKKLSPLYQTYSLEVFHNVINHFAPKSTHFFYQSMLGRMKLAAMHFNENRTKKQATTKDGKERYTVCYPKSKKGEAVVAKPVREGPSYVYVKVIKEWVVKRRVNIPTYKKAALNAIENLPQAPPTLTKGYKAYNKTEVIECHRSRFK